MATAAEVAAINSSYINVTRSDSIQIALRVAQRHHDIILQFSSFNNRTRNFEANSSLLFAFSHRDFFLSTATGDTRETAFLFQSRSVVIQRSRRRAGPLAIPTCAFSLFLAL